MFSAPLGLYPVTETISVLARSLAYVDLLGDHLRGDRRAGVVVLPGHVVLGAGARGDVGKPALQVTLGLEQGSGRHGVDGLRLVADDHVDDIARRLGRGVQRATGRGDGKPGGESGKPDQVLLHSWCPQRIK
jgi:hypothetical protein